MLNNILNIFKTLELRSAILLTIAGVATCIVFLVIKYALWALYKLSSNHLHHINADIIEQKEAFTELKGSIQTLVVSLDKVDFVKFNIAVANLNKSADRLNETVDVLDSHSRAEHSKMLEILNRLVGRLDK